MAKNVDYVIYITTKHGRKWSYLKEKQPLDTNRSQRSSPPTQRRATVVAPTAATRSLAFPPPDHANARWPAAGLGEIATGGALLTPLVPARWAGGR